MNKPGMMKYAAHNGPWPSDPPAKHIAYHTRQLATDLTPKQRREHETALRVWQLKANVQEVAA